MNIDSISNGIIIDHIQAKKGFKIYEYLKLGDLNCSVAIITNAKSKKMGRKDIIKIDGNVKLNLEILGYIDSNITVNLVENNKIIDKHKAQLPKEIVGIIKCKNPRCITSTEQELKHIFILTDIQKKAYRCKYCETLNEEQ